MYIYSGTPLARPPTGGHSIGRVSGAGVVASHLHSKWFHALSRSLHFCNSFPDWKLFSFVLRAAIIIVTLLQNHTTGKVDVGGTNSRRVYSMSLSWVYLAKVKNFKDEKEIIAIAKTPGHRKKRKVIESLPLDWSIKVHSKPNLHRIG